MCREREACTHVSAATPKAHKSCPISNNQLEDMHTHLQHQGRHRRRRKDVEGILDAQQREQAQGPKGFWEEGRGVEAEGGEGVEVPGVELLSV